MTQPGRGGELLFDSATGAQLAIDYDHHKVHGGSMFVSDTWTTGASLSVGFKTPATTKWGHFVAEFHTESKAHLVIYEGRTWTTGSGSQLPVYDHNRNTANTTSMLEDTGTGYVAGNLVSRPDGISGGTAIKTDYTYADKKTGDTKRGHQEFVLASDTVYSFDLLSDDGSKGLYLSLNWYEHTDLN